MILKPLIIIAGPTAVGKSHMAVLLAKKINGEIISADSMQVYKGCDIGSAKITKEEMSGIKHYLIDVYPPTADYNVTVFQKMAKEAIEEIYSKGKIPIICGGTGFYIQSLLYDVDFEESQGEISEYRELLEKRYLSEGADVLFEELRKVDPKTCETIHKNNMKKVIRALEFYHETNTPFSEHNERMQAKTSVYDAAFFVLNDKRENIYEKINKRVDLMMRDGLLEEVIGLKNSGLLKTNVSMQGLGYKELFSYLDDEISLEEAVDAIKQGSRHYAKRQITWFKREKDVIWVNLFEHEYSEEKILDYMLDCISKKGLLNEQEG